jgi:nitric oxide reductase subunit C
MLSKSQAKVFFLGGTAVFTAAFLGLTIDSMRQIPALTNEDQITPAVERGKMIWERNNCMGCHTLFGEGAYYAPELTKVVDRRGKPWIKLFLKDPQKMFPGERKMVNYHFTDAQMDDVIAFLEWCGRVNLQGFPAPPPLAGKMQPVIASGALSQGPQPELFKTICLACHTVGGAGGNVGPPLDDVRQRKTREELLAWIANPQSIKPGTAMPQIDMTEAQRGEIVDFLLSLSATAPVPLPKPNAPQSFE